MPWLGSNALGPTSKAIDKILNYTPDLDCSTDIFNYLGLFGIETKPSVENLELIINEAYEKNPSLGSLLKALSRMTVTPTIIKGGIKSNSVPESIEIVLDVRTLPFQNDTKIDGYAAYLQSHLAGYISTILHMLRGRTLPLLPLQTHRTLRYCLS